MLSLVIKKSEIRTVLDKAFASELDIKSKVLESNGVRGEHAEGNLLAFFRYASAALEMCMSQDMLEALAEDSIPGYAFVNAWYATTAALPTFSAYADKLRAYCEVKCVHLTTSEQIDLLVGCAKEFTQESRFTLESGVTAKTTYQVVFEDAMRSYENVPSWYISVRTIISAPNTDHFEFASKFYDLSKCREALQEFERHLTLLRSGKVEIQNDKIVLFSADGKEQKSEVLEFN